MREWKNIAIGLLIALAVTTCILCAQGSSEVFIYNNF